jgi:hypothetical protein
VGLSFHSRSSVDALEISSCQFIFVPLVGLCLSGCFRKAQYVVFNLSWTALGDPLHPVPVCRMRVCVRFRGRARFGMQPWFACADCGEKQIHQAKLGAVMEDCLREQKFGAGNWHIASASASPIHKHLGARTEDRQNHPASGRRSSTFDTPLLWRTAIEIRASFSETSAEPPHYTIPWALLKQPVRHRIQNDVVRERCAQKLSGHQHIHAVHDLPPAAAGEVRKFMTMPGKKLFRSVG